MLRSSSIVQLIQNNFIPLFPVRFYKNDSVPFPEEVCNSQTVFLAGELTVVDLEGEAEGFIYHKLTDTDLSLHNLPAPTSFLLTVIEGNPKIITYYAQYDILASFNVMMARAEDPQNDILFTGDDHNTEGFLAWKRQMD